jgi:hypothetical protein
MRNFGFSTGTLARSDISKALHIVAHLDTGAVEYSALRMSELEAAVDYLIKNGTGEFDYVAFHAPSSFTALEEGRVVTLLRQLVVKFALHIVVHPDTIHDHLLWDTFGDKLCIENMDHRKLIGRTADELDCVFKQLPNARLCFDIGHAHEIDRSMSVGYEILRRYGSRIAHVHASEVSDECEHRAFSASSHTAFAMLADLIPRKAPVILETDTPENRVGEQLNEAKNIFRGSAAMKFVISSSQDSEVPSGSI